MDRLEQIRCFDCLVLERSTLAFLFQYWAERWRLQILDVVIIIIEPYLPEDAFWITPLNLLLLRWLTKWTSASDYMWQYHRCDSITLARSLSKHRTQTALTSSWIMSAIVYTALWFLLGFSFSKLVVMLNQKPRKQRLVGYWKLKLFFPFPSRFSASVKIWITPVSPVIVSVVPQWSSSHNESCFFFHSVLLHVRLWNRSPNDVWNYVEWPTADSCLWSLTTRLWALSG